MRPVNQPPLDLLLAQQGLGVESQLGVDDDGVGAAGDDERLAAKVGQAAPGGLLGGDGGEADRRHEGVREAYMGVELPGDGCLDGEAGAGFG